MKFLPLKNLVLQGIILGFSAIITVIITAIVYATVSWGSLPTATTGSGLSANAWNDLVAHVNQSVKQASQVITVSGSNVGIGTINPTVPLSVTALTTSASAQFRANGSRSWIQIINSNSTGSVSSAIDIGNPSNNKLFEIGNDYEQNGTQSFYIADILNSVIRFYIGNSGNVGIGTITPNEKLDISNGGAIRLNSNSAQPLNIFVARGDGGGNSGNVYCALPTTGGGRTNAVCLAAWDQSGASVGCSATVLSSHLARFLCVAP